MREMIFTTNSHYLTCIFPFNMAVASGGGGGGGGQGGHSPPSQKPPLKNNRNQNTYLNILGILGMESYDFR